MIKINIDNIEIEVKENITILQAAKLAHINIPTLCYHEDLSIKSVCRICVVEVNGQKLLQPACSYPVSANMVIKTNTPRVIEARKGVMELILSHHPMECLSCSKNNLCELQSIATDLNMNSPIPYEVETRNKEIDNSSVSITFDGNKCIICGRCAEVCNDIQTVGVLAKENRGRETVIAPPYGKKLVDTACINCGQCVQVCPVGALTINDQTNVFYNNKKIGKTIVAQIAPSSRTTIAEALGSEPGVAATGKMVTAMKMLGFDYVFDSDFSADLTIMEEGNELLHRITNNGVLPMITSCCPGWVKFCETYYSEFTDHLSTAKSPQQMFGAVIKTFFAEKQNIPAKDICSVSIMPCTAKKFESIRFEMNDSGHQDVDLSLTVQELAKMIKAAGIDFDKLDETPFDNPFGLGTGAGEIFAATGGVMEAALRTVYEVLTGTELKEIEFHDVRGYDWFKDATITINDIDVKVAVVHSLGEARKLMDKIKKKEIFYHFVEVMACPGGCIGGGGNPTRTKAKVIERTKSVYAQDEDLPIRKSHESPAIKMIYSEFLGEPLSYKSHKLLHTKYKNRKDVLRL
ncbi:MAG: NADH-dependent [FeFe] hydrogenase, group A6 [Lachnospirales bacterium]